MYYELTQYMSIFESIILGAVQGIAEWLPVSSEGLIFLIKINFFNSGEGVMEITSLALFLHFGTFLAALVYFWKDVSRLLKPSFLLPFLRGEYGGHSVMGIIKNATHIKRNTDIKLLRFLFFSTLISGSLGFTLLKVFEGFEETFFEKTKLITIVVGVLLLLTAFLQFKAKKGGKRFKEDLARDDSILLGLAQGFAVLPGLSRSGLTVSTLLLRKFNEESALKLSFLMSMPIVLAGNIILNINDTCISYSKLIALASSFIFGLITIDLLLKLAKKINFAWFVLVFGLLMIVSGLV